MNNLYKMLYTPFQHWLDGKSLWFFSDTHFGDPDCLLMDKTWPSPADQVAIINEIVPKNATFVLLGDVGAESEWVSGIRARNKVLVMGNHDVKSVSVWFNEFYKGPVFISPKILLSHEPIPGLNFCLNIHGHDHDPAHWINEHGINLAANVCGYEPMSLQDIIKKGYLDGLDDIHRQTIDLAILKKEGREHGKENQ